MNKPADIPQDVWDFARKPANIACAPHNTPEIAHTIVARAIMAERGRAAAKADLMAENFKRDDLSARLHGQPHQAETYSYISDRFRECAAAIRQGAAA